MSFENIVNGIARPAIGFFLGMAAANVVELAGSTGWWVALGFTAFVAGLFGLVLLFDNALHRFFDRIGWGTGVMAAKNRARAGKPHWFVRFGWIFGLIVGFAAVYALPEEALSWL
jgi:hypothetical protein